VGSAAALRARGLELVGAVKPGSTFAVNVSGVELSPWLLAPGPSYDIRLISSWL
jgi:hypothetical protein